MNGTGLNKRLRRLERAAGIGPAPDWRDWPLEDQLQDVADIHWLQGLGRSAYSATDREIHLMGLLAALWELPGGAGEYRFPSGAAVSWSEAGADGKQGVEASGRVRVEDLPEEVRERWRRMDPERQPAREGWLYENRRRPGEPGAREQVRLHEERVRAYEEASKQGGRELLERNRAACGLPALTPEQIAEWGLEGTRREGPDAA